MSTMYGVIGKGTMERALTPGEIREICATATADLPVTGKRVLVLIPDHTRHAPIDLFFQILTDLLCPRVKHLDFLVAAGTHRPMEADRLYRHVGITAQRHATEYRNVHLFNHEHDKPPALTTLGVLPGSDIAAMTDGLFEQDIPVSINKKAVEYDFIIIVSPVVPHEAMGFAGGNKYFFPGIGGMDIIETFHWLAAVITNPVVNGVKDTPTRRVIDRAAMLLQTPRICLAFAVNDEHRLACLFAGEPRAAWALAADYSARLHVRYVGQPCHTILAVTPEIYEEIWVGGKAMYKLEPIVAEGGELIIYGPQIREISFAHGNAIRKVGYHVRDYFTKQWEKFSREPKLILAHSTNVRGIGTFENGVETPRIAVTLATSISEEVCRSINLGYRDYRDIDPGKWKSQQQTGMMVVEEAGQDLYRLQSEPA